MELKLTHDEVQQYFDMQSDLAYYQQKAQELEDELDMLREQQYREDTGMEPITESTDTYDRSGTRWDAE